MNWRLLKTGFLILVIICSLTSLHNVSADGVIDDGKKSISTCYKINNMDEYEEYIFLRLMKSNLPPNSYSILNKDIYISAGNFFHAGPRTYEYVTCAIPKSDFNESDFNQNASKFEDFFGNNSNIIFSNYFEQFYGPVSKNHPLESAVVNAEIRNINETCLEITKISVNYTYADGTFEETNFIDQNLFPTPSKGLYEDEEIPILWFIVIPLVALISIISVIILRKRR